MEAKLALYDILTRLVPGAFFLWAIRLLWPGLQTSVPVAGEGEIASGGAWFVLSYVAGYALDHLGRYLVQPLARAIGGGDPAGRWLVDHPKLCEEERTSLRKLAQTWIGAEWEQFDSESEKARALSRRAFRFALAQCEDTSEKLRALRAQYGVNRTIATACCALLVLSAARALAVPAAWFYPVGFLLAGFVFLLGTKHYDTEFIRNVFEVARTRERPGTLA